MNMTNPNKASGKEVRFKRDAAVRARRQAEDHIIESVRATLRSLPVETRDQLTQPDMLAGLVDCLEGAIHGYTHGTSYRVREVLDHYHKQKDPDDYDSPGARLRHHEGEPDT